MEEDTDPLTPQLFLELWQQLADDHDGPPAADTLLEQLAITPGEQKTTLRGLVADQVQHPFEGYIKTAHFGYLGLIVWVGVTGLTKVQRGRLVAHLLDSFEGLDEEAAVNATLLMVDCIEPLKVKQLMKHKNSKFFWQMFLIVLNKISPEKVHLSFRLFEMGLEFDPSLLPASDLRMAFSILIRHMLQVHDLLASDIKRFIEQVNQDPLITEQLQEAAAERWPDMKIK